MSEKWSDDVLTIKSATHNRTSSLEGIDTECTEKMEGEWLDKHGKKQGVKVRRMQVERIFKEDSIMNYLDSIRNYIRNVVDQWN